ncbi:MAG TPA: hypothetical protein VGR16_06355 [Thermomicrobiales bacterium]|nr:hypothetical protein [Thermomicrobiales bacterium]
MAQRERRQVPEVRRPRGAAWRSLQREGLVWEGQAFLVGADFDLAARLIVTRERLAVVRGGTIILNAPRSWLRPAPRLLPDGNVMLTILPEDQGEATGQPETLVFRMREGWGDASHLVTLLGGSRRPRLPSPGAAPAVRAAPLMPVEVDDPLGWARPDASQSVTRASDQPSRGMSTAERTSPLSHEPADRGVGATPAPGSDPPWGRAHRAPRPIDVPVVTPASDEKTANHGRDSYVLPARPAPAAVGRHYDWNLPPGEVVTSRDTRRRRGWFLRLGSLLALVLVAVGVAVISGDRDGGDPTLEGARITDPAGVAGGSRGPGATATDAPSPTPTPSATPRVPDESNRTIPLAGNDETAVALGVGSDLSPTATNAPVGAPPATVSVPPTQGAESDEPTSAQDVDQPVATSTATMPSATETPLPTATPTATSVAPTPTPTEEAPATEVLAAVATVTPPPPTAPLAQTAVATRQPAATPDPPPPTAEPAPATPNPPTPTDEPPTATPEPPTATATATATPEPKPSATPSPTPEPSLPAQPASVDAEGYTAPAMEAGAFRLTVESTMKAPAMPGLGLPANPYGDWLVAVVYAYNWSDAPANLVMENFGLITANPYVEFMPLDSGTSLVSSALGYDLPLGSTDVVVFGPGEGHRIGLLFTADPAGSGFALRYGPAALGLQSSLEASPNVDELGAPPPEPSLLQATVTEVIDGDTIAVEVEGVEAIVRYAAVRAPELDACYGPEAAAANGALVGVGDTVYLERQATNADEDGALVRDVWINLDGVSALVANELAAVGAVDVLTDTPNDRFTSWLQVTVAEAAFLEQGMWGACGGDVGDGRGGVAAALRGSATSLPRPPALGGVS